MKHRPNLSSPLESENQKSQPMIIIQENHPKPSQICPIASNTNNPKFTTHENRRKPSKTSTSFSIMIFYHLMHPLSS